MAPIAAQRCWCSSCAELEKRERIDEHKSTSFSMENAVPSSISKAPIVYSSAWVAEDKTLAHSLADTSARVLGKRAALGLGPFLLICVRW